MNGIEIETALFEKAAGADAFALRALLEHFGPQVRGRIAAKIGSRWRAAVDADDVMQVTYLEAFFSIREMSARDGASFVCWLTRIAENNLHDAIKGLERHKRPDPARRLQAPAGEDSYVALLDALRCTSTTPSRQFARGESRRHVQVMLERLPEDYRTVVRWYDLEGRPSGEIAEAMGRSVGAVLMLRARAHDRLKELLGSASQVGL